MDRTVLCVRLARCVIGSDDCPMANLWLAKCLRGKRRMKSQPKASRYRASWPNLFFIESFTESFIESRHSLKRLSSSKDCSILSEFGLADPKGWMGVRRTIVHLPAHFMAACTMPESSSNVGRIFWKEPTKRDGNASKHLKDSKLPTIRPDN